MRASPSRSLVLIAPLLLAGCGGYQLASGPPPADPIPYPEPRPEVGRLPEAGSGGLMGDERTACRSGTFQSGWIAVGYVQLGSECPSTGDDGGYNGVRLLRYEGLMVGATLVVCADEPTPRGWEARTSPPDASCEGARVRDGKPTAKRIHRVW